MSGPPLSASETEAVAELADCGSTVLRGAWRQEHLATLHAGIQLFLAMRAAHVAQGKADPMLALNHRHGIGTGANLVRAGCLDPDLLREMFTGSAYHRICRAFFGEDEGFYAHLNRLAFRSHDPAGPGRSFVPWHQDSGSQDPRMACVLNCWTPLDPGAGRESPGLEVVRALAPPGFELKDFGGLRENEAYDAIAIDQARITQAFGPDCFLAPEFELGDGFVFSQDVIHRTHVTPQMTRPRTGFELRVFTPRHLAPGATIADFGDRVVRLA